MVWPPCRQDSHHVNQDNASGDAPLSPAFIDGSPLPRIVPKLSKQIAHLGKGFRQDGQHEN